MNKLKIFDHIGNGKFDLIVETETILEETEDYILEDIADNIYNILKRKCYEDLPRDMDCIIMINNQAFYRFEKTEDIYSCDIIEADYMNHFIEWYRKEYNDVKFNGNNNFANVWGLAE